MKLANDRSAPGTPPALELDMPIGLLSGEVNPHACIFTKDLAGKYLFANEPLQQALGLPLADIVGQDDSIFFDWGNAEAQRETDRRVLELGETVELQDVATFKRTGQARLYAINKQPLRDSAGAIVGMVGVSVDITEKTPLMQYLAEKQRLQTAILDSMTDLLAVINSQGVIISSNRPWQQALSAATPGGEATVHTLSYFDALSYLVGPEGSEQLEPIFGQLRAFLRAESEILMADYASCDGAQKRWFSLRATHLRGTSNENHAVVSHRDITNRRNNAERLRIAASVFLNAQEGILITNSEGNIVDINETFERISGYERTELLGRNPRLFNSGRQDQTFYTTMWTDLTAKGHWTGEVWNRRKSGEIYAIMQSIVAVHNDHGAIQHYIAHVSDVTAVKNHRVEMDTVIHYDVLTRLPNRLLLSDRIVQKLAHARRSNESIAVVCLDLDDFKDINEEHGMHAGDQVLIQVANRLLANIRVDDTVARLGGDEFVILLGNVTSRTVCDQKIRSLNEELCVPYLLDDGKKVSTSASIGYTIFPEDDTNPDTLIRHADQAMYAAKHSGKNRCNRFDIIVDTRHKTNWSALAKIEHGLERGEFRLYLQPKVSLISGAVVGAEALIRWKHPIRGVTPPGQFLPLLEGQPLMNVVGKWVLHEAFQIATNWSELGMNIPLSVNVDAQQLRDGDFTAQLSQLLSEFPSVRPGMIELEIVESAALDDIQKVSDLINDCRSLGFLFSLDDFGTGYSSLTYLKRLAVDTLKIDQSFVREMMGDDSALAIVRGVIGLADAFHSHTVAEGVETWEHASVLRSLGCQTIQGYVLSRPMPAEQFPAWVKQFSIPKY